MFPLLEAEELAFPPVPPVPPAPPAPPCAVLRLEFRTFELPLFETFELPPVAFELEVPPVDVEFDALAAVEVELDALVAEFDCD